MVDESGLPEVVLVVFLGEASDDNGQASVDEPVDLALFCCDEARELVYVHGCVCLVGLLAGGDAQATTRGTDFRRDESRLYKGLLRDISHRKRLMNALNAM